MYKVFIAMYDDTTKAVPYKSYTVRPITVYRTANMEFIEELSGLGFEPLAVLLEEDIEEIRNGSYTNDAVEAKDLTLLTEAISHWELKENSSVL